MGNSQSDTEAANLEEAYTQRVNANTRKIGDDLNSHESNAYAQARMQRNEMEKNRRKEVDAIRADTASKLKELGDERRETEKKFENESRTLMEMTRKDHLYKKKALEKKHAEWEREETSRIEMAMKEQNAASSEAYEIQKKAMAEGLNESRKEEELRMRLTMDQQQLNAKIDREFHETQQLDLQTHIQLEDKFGAKVEENFQVARSMALANHNASIRNQRQLLDVRIAQSRSDDVKEVDRAITNIKELAEAIKNQANKLSYILNPVLQANEKKQAIIKVEIVDTNLSTLLDDLSKMDRLSKKLLDAEYRDELNDQIRHIKQCISDAKDAITEVKRDLMYSPMDFDVQNRKNFIDAINSVVRGVQAIRQLPSGDEQTKLAIRNLAPEVNSSCFAVEESGGNEAIEP